MPTPMSISGSPRSRHFPRRTSSRAIIVSAALHARSAWSGCSCGAPQNAMIASPMYLSRVPWFSETMISVIGVRYSFRSSRRTCGSSFSEMDVNPRMSLNRTVRTRFSPPSWTEPPFESTSSTFAGARKRLKAARARHLQPLLGEEPIGGRDDEHGEHLRERHPEREHDVPAPEREDRDPRPDAGRDEERGERCERGHAREERREADR